MGKTHRFWFTVFAVFGLLSFLNLSAQSEAFGASERILWSFGKGTDGVDPEAGLISDTRGNLYGTTYGGGANKAGTVFELKNNGKSRTESVLYSFGKVPVDGQNPYADLAQDANGNLYGTTQNGGVNGLGTVFELTPPSSAGGNWDELILYSFGSNPNDGNTPQAGLIIDANGNLYGTTEGGGAFSNSKGCNFPSCSGTVFELSPPRSGGNWTESILWSFGNGTDGAYLVTADLIRDASGNLYGTTVGGGTNDEGTVFELSPPATSGGVWTESILLSLGSNADGDDPFSGLIMDKNGNLYGTTFGVNENGTVFELTPATGQGNWTESVLWNFGNPKDGHSPLYSLLMDTGGNLYGTTFGGGDHGQSGFLGTVFELAPPVTAGGPWTESVLWSFAKSRDGGPGGSLIMDNGGNLYATTAAATTSPAPRGIGGTVFTIHVLGLAAAPTKMNFGNLAAPGTSKAKRVTLTNKGAVSANIADVTATVPFTIAGGANTCSGQTISPKGTFTFYVEFVPTTVGKATGGIDVNYNGTSPALALTGNGIAPK